MTTLPAQAADLRALLLMDSLPTGCILHPITDGASWPHLKPGEFAVADTTDHTPSRGELFVIQYPSTGHRFIVGAFRHARVMSEEDRLGCWCVGALVRPGTPEELRLRFNRGDTRHLVYDGPYRSAEYLSEKLVGRVIGVFASAFDEARLRTV